MNDKTELKFEVFAYKNDLCAFFNNKETKPKIINIIWDGRYWVAFYEE